MMGLGITAYRRLRPVRAWGGDEDDDVEDGELHPYVENFPDRAPEYNDQTVYAVEDFDTDVFVFQAGSCTWYGEWRTWLAALVGTTPKAVWNGEPAVAFGELINFSDCEGTIGPAAAARLAKDFAEYDDAARAADTSFMGAFYELYAEFKTAFEMASDAGAVEFH